MKSCKKEKQFVMIQLQRQTGKSHRANFFTTLIYRNTDGIAVSGFMD